MKVKTISRSKDDYVKQKDGDVDKVHHNLDEKYHPFQQQREVWKDASDFMISISVL